MRRKGLITSLCVMGFSALSVLSAWAFQSTAKVPDPQRGYTRFSDPSKRFTIDHPRDWLVIAGPRGFQITIAERSGKGIIDAEWRVMPFSAPEVLDDVYRKEILDELQERQPQAQKVVPVPWKERPRVVIVDYQREGMTGPEHLRQYTFFEGTVLLRLTCLAPAKEYDKQRQVFDAVVGSVRISPGVSGGLGSH